MTSIFSKFTEGVRAKLLPPGTEISLPQSGSSSFARNMAPANKLKKVSWILCSTLGSG